MLRKFLSQLESVKGEDAQALQNRVLGASNAEPAGVI
jgi:hypothetical protein